MERNSFSHSLKDHSIGCNKAVKENSSINNNYNYKLKDSSPWSSTSSTNNQGFGDQEYLSGFSWPPRSYTCSFCKREFRSAQALGGHMNVHRRDRARLRQSPPPPRDIHGQPHPPPFLNLNLNPNPNPNPNFPSLLPPRTNLSSPPNSAFPTHHHEMKKWRPVNGTLSIDPLSSPCSDSTNMMKGNNAKSFFGVKEFKDYGCNKLVMKNSNATSEYVRLDLDLEIGLVSDSKEDLDLELRLGYS